LSRSPSLDQDTGPAHQASRAPGGVGLPALALAGLALVLSARPLQAQATGLAPDSGSFAVLHAGDTVAVESFVRLPGELDGRLVLAGASGERLAYHAVVLPDAGTPLVEVSAWRAGDPDRSPPRERTRLIFRDDSVAIDQLRRTGLETRVLPTAHGALPYLNLSFALLEQATRRVRAGTWDSLAVPFFNLGGGQTATGLVRRLGADSMTIQIGPVEFRLAVDAEGRIVGGAIPAQNVRVIRHPG
jgi:hypothetical protein